MDLRNERSDNVITLAAIGAAASALKPAIKGIQERLILKKAKKKIAAGKANTLSGREIDICLEAGIDKKTFETNPKYMSRPNVIAEKAQAIKNAGAAMTDTQAIDSAKKEAENVNAAVNIKQYLPYILGGVGLILLLFILKRK